MPEYDNENYNPPAPVAYVTLRNTATGEILSNVPMLVDTGSDTTLLPSEAVKKLGVDAEEDAKFEVQVFDGDTKFLKVVKLELHVLDKKFRGEYLLIDRPIGILGRNVLNNLRILFDGPRRKWDENKR